MLRFPTNLSISPSEDPETIGSGTPDEDRPILRKGPSRVRVELYPRNSSGTHAQDGQEAEGSLHPETLVRASESTKQHLK